jgi:hypothetical protein
MVSVIHSSCRHRNLCIEWMKWLQTEGELASVRAGERESGRAFR